MPVSRFCVLAGIPERTYRRRLVRLRDGDPPKGPWPATKVDGIEAVAAEYAADWPAWGHRKVAALMRADGHDVSASTVLRALRRRGLVLPQGFRADRKSWAALRRKVFTDPPTERNRVWQTDFSEFETATGGISRICAVIDYATKYCRAVTVGPTARGRDALACLRQAVAEAERLTGLGDLRDDRGLMPLLDADGTTIGMLPAPIAVVSDNGPCFRGEVFAEAFLGEDPLLRHVRTRVKSTQSNGVVERFFGTLKYEHLYRAEITDGDALAMELQRFRQIYNKIRPHQALGDHAPRQAYLGGGWSDGPRHNNQRFAPQKPEAKDNDRCHGDRHAADPHGVDEAPPRFAGGDGAQRSQELPGCFLLHYLDVLGSRQPPAELPVVDLDVGVPVLGQDRACRVRVQRPDQRRRTQPVGAVVGQQRPVRDQLVPIGRHGARSAACPALRPSTKYRLPPVRPPGKSHIVRPSVLRHRRSSTSRYTPPW